MSGAPRCGRCRNELETHLVFLRRFGTLEDIRVCHTCATILDGGDPLDPFSDPFPGAVENPFPHLHDLPGFGG